jgi:protease I
MSRPRELIFTSGDAAESLGVMHPYQRLKEEGYEVHLAAPSMKTLHFVVHDFGLGIETYTEKPGYSWDADLAFADVDPADYVALVIPGARVYLQQPGPSADHPAHLRAGEAGGPGIPRAAGTAGDGRVMRGLRGGSGRHEIMSARAWLDHASWMRELIRLLKQKAPMGEGEAAVTR